MAMPCKPSDGRCAERKVGIDDAALKSNYESHAIIVAQAATAQAQTLIHASASFAMHAIYVVQSRLMKMVEGGATLADIMRELREATDALKTP